MVNNASEMIVSEQHTHSVITTLLKTNQGGEISKMLDDDYFRVIE